MHIAYNKFLPFIMKYQNILNSFRDFGRNCFPIFRIFRKPENSTEMELSNIPAIPRFYSNGWNNAKFRAYCAFQSVSNKFFIANFRNSNRSLEEDKKYATYRSYGALLFSVPSLYKHFTTVKASP